MRDIAAQLRSDLSGLDRRTVFALVYAAVGLTAISYLKDPRVLAFLLSGTPFSGFGDEAVLSTDNNLHALVWWVIVSLFFYFVAPAAAVVFIQKRSLGEIGLAIKAERGFLQLLSLCVAIMLPLVYLMSLTSSFASKYPFLHVYNDQPYLSSTLLVWELIYFLQFFGLEFFFRGFLVHSLKPQLGMYAIFVMTVPYTMIHLQKPAAEAFAAVVAGIFLGWISYKNGTIWLGLILHCSVAFAMDTLALWNKGLLF